MQITEYRITLPLTLQEYQIAQLFTINESLKTENSCGGNVVVLRNEPFSDLPILNGKQVISGQYTSKVYKWSSKIPQFIKSILPQDAMEIHEDAWDAYPYCRTHYTSTVYLKERFHIKIESLHFENDCGTQDNAHELQEELLRQRKVVFIDIANDVVSSKDYKENEDPSKFQSAKTGRGPLKGPLWRETCQPVMTCYKLVTCEVKTFGLKSTFETLLQTFERRIFTNFHRQLFCSIDRWYDISLDDVKDKEEQVANEEIDKNSEMEKSKVEEMKKMQYN